MFEEFDNKLDLSSSVDGAKIKIIGVGGAGNNAVNKMLDDRIRDIDFIVANTDSQILKDSRVSKKIILGKKITKGLGAGAIPEVGKKAAEESIDEIKEFVKDSDLVFIAAGMGGGTGTGASPIIAKTAKEEGAIVIGIVTTPFSFEGKKRERNSFDGLSELSKVVDSIIVVSNDRLLDELGNIPLSESFQYSDAILKQAVRTITDLITERSIINLDFADIKNIIENKGPALIGVGRATGDNASVEAAIDAINSPILESSIEGAKSAIINVTGGPKGLTIEKAKDAVETIKEASQNEMDVIFGITINEALGDEIIVSVIATGLKDVNHEVFNSNSFSTDTSSLAKISKDETDIKKYKSHFLTKEIDMDELEKIRGNTNSTKKNFNMSSSTDSFSKKTIEASNNDMFKGLSLLDEDEDDSMDFDAREVK